jgi:hypothetical protein
MCLEPAEIKFPKQLLALIKLHYQANREINDRFQDQNIESTIFHRYQKTCNYPKKSTEGQIITLKNEEHKKSVDWTVPAEDVNKELCVETLNKQLHAVPDTTL